MRMHKSDIEEDSVDLFEREEQSSFWVDGPPRHSKWINEHIVLWFTNDILSQIGLTYGYTGKLSSGLGIGDLVSEFEAIYGGMYEGDEDELEFQNLPGLCFDVDYQGISEANWREIIPGRPVKWLHLFGQ